MAHDRTFFLFEKVKILLSKASDLVSDLLRSESKDRDVWLRSFGILYEGHDLFQYSRIDVCLAFLAYLQRALGDIKGMITANQENSPIHVAGGKP
jgi:hypothetical protein